MGIIQANLPLPIIITGSETFTPHTLLGIVGRSPYLDVAMGRAAPRETNGGNFSTDTMRFYEKPRAFKPSYPAAHPKKRLLLLPSGPDRVHALKSHGTQPSLYTRLDDYTMPPVKKQQFSLGRRKKVRNSS